MSYDFEVQKYTTELKQILVDIQESPKFNKNALRRILQTYPKDGNSLFSKNQLVRGYDYLVKAGEMKFSEDVITRIRMKPTRTISGVVPVTVLTKPFHCPGECIFCPLEKNMPKSYLRDEPGCQRAEKNNFSPYMQVYSRLLAYKNTGHNTSKVELIVLGGTWSYYPKHYQVWFVKELFRALNDFGVKEPEREFEPKGIQVRGIEPELWEKLIVEQKKNENALSRSVGLSIETRPDFVTESEVVRLRRLGCTKIQIGVQSTNDKVLKLNKRGHKHEASIKAADTLRRAGFKVQVHYMPNLYGSTPKIDISGYKKMFKKNDVLPDELKLYPTSIIKNTGLYDLFSEGKYLPYTEEELLLVLKECLNATREFTRLSRVVRDIPSTYIEAGNKKTNFREMAERVLLKEGRPVKDIRAREIRNERFDPEKIRLKITKYETRVSHERFLQYITPENKIIGFLRLSLPKDSSKHFIGELKNSAIIREIHVYGVSMNIDEKNINNIKSQHLGLGTKLIAKAREISKKEKFRKLSVISAIGTREYYKKKGFDQGELYQYMKL